MARPKKQVVDVVEVPKRSDNSFPLRMVHPEGSEAIAQNEKDVSQLEAIGFGKA